MRKCKQIYELTPSDLASHPVWFFPMDDTVEDEASVCPVADGSDIPSGLQAIIRADFVDALGRSYPGYVYAVDEDTVDYVRPVLWAGEHCITFWEGMLPPAPEYITLVSALFRRDAWPIRYVVDPSGGLGERHGRLEGIY